MFLKCVRRYSPRAREAEKTHQDHRQFLSSPPSVACERTFLGVGGVLKLCSRKRVSSVAVAVAVAVEQS